MIKSFGNGYAERAKQVGRYFREEFEKFKKEMSSRNISKKK